MIGHYETKMQGKRIACVIPSKNIENLRVCVSAVRVNDPAVRIVVVDDSEGREIEFYCAAMRIACVKGKKPFVFARNINIGIRAAGEMDGVVLLNDDAILETPNGFTTLADAAELRRVNFGIVSAAVRGMVAAKEQEPWSYPHLKEQFPLADSWTIRTVKHHMMAFVCVYIPTYTLEEVGLLDERYTEYGYDDDDYCQRVKNAGYALGVFDGCVVEHGSRPSTFRSRPGTSLEPNRKAFIEKWGHAPGKAPVPAHA